MPDGDQPVQIGERTLSSFFDTIGKALGSLAGLAVFIYVVGGLTVLARLQRLDLPAEVVVPKIPRERLALVGLAQLLWTLVLGGLIAALAIWMLPDREPEESWPQWWGRIRRERKKRWVPAVAVVAAIVLIAPLSANGLLYVGVLVTGVTWFVAWSRLHGRLISVAVALLLAGAVTVLRQLEFPTPFTAANVTLTTESAELIQEDDVTEGVIHARVVQTTGDEILLSWESKEQNEREERLGVRLPPRLLVIPRDSVEEIRYQLPAKPQSHSDSLAQHLVGHSVPPLPLMCLLPTCEWDESGDIEEAEPTFSPPFVF